MKTLVLVFHPHLEKSQVAEVAEHQRAQRTGDERDGEGQQAGQQRDGRIGGGLILFYCLLPLQPPA